MTSLHTTRVRPRSLGAALAAAGLLTALRAGAGPASATPDPGDLTPGSSSGAATPRSAAAAPDREIAPGEITGRDEIVHRKI
ncbi:hypothetical protein ACWGIP_05580, partial [Streptomyces sp. NPDC054838]